MEYHNGEIIVPIRAVRSECLLSIYSSPKEESHDSSMPSIDGKSKAVILKKLAHELKSEDESEKGTQDYKSKRQKRMIQQSTNIALKSRTTIRKESSRYFKKRES